MGTIQGIGAFEVVLVLFAEDPRGVVLDLVAHHDVLLLATLVTLQTGEGLHHRAAGFVR